MMMIRLLVVYMLSLMITKTVMAICLEEDQGCQQQQKKQKNKFDNWLKRFPRSYAPSLSGISGRGDNGDHIRKGNSNNGGGGDDEVIVGNDDNINNEKEEYIKRFGIFQTNLKKIHNHNSAYKQKLTSYVMTINNEFGDMTDDEFIASKYLMESQNCSATTNSRNNKLRRPKIMSSSLLSKEKNPNGSSSGVYKPDLNKNIDWRTKGVITPIKNQKHCGSCWTFSTTGCLEAHTCIQAKAKANGDNKDFDCTSWTGLAEQQLVDCAQHYNNFGCNGGLPSQAFEYIKYSGGIDLETSYPYKANETGSCLASKGIVGGKVAEVINITTKDEDDLEYAVGAIGPVSIAYQVSSDFRHYSHGIYDSYNVTTNSTMCNSTAMDVNHAVVAVGLGTTTTDIDKTKNVTTRQPYYIVRNSWGTSWGMEGYFWMLRGVNLCGVSDCASFPLVPRNSNVDEETAEETAKENIITKHDLLNHAMESASSIL